MKIKLGQDQVALALERYLNKVVLQQPHEVVLVDLGEDDEGEFELEVTLEIEEE